MADENSEPTSNFWAVALVLFSLAVMVLLASDTPIPKEFVIAEVVGVHERQSETPGPTLLTAKLPSGQVIRVGGTSGLPRKIGAKIRVQKMERELLGMVTFRFVEFVDE